MLTISQSIKNEQASFTREQTHSAISISSYMTRPMTIDESATCEQLVNMFKQNPNTECIVLVDAFNRPLTLFMRNALFMKFSRRYSSDLFYEKPVSVLVEQAQAPLVLDMSTSPEQVIQFALNRDIQTRYDCVIIVSGENILKGVLTLSNILELSNELQKHAKYEQAALIEKAVGYVHHIAEQMKLVETEIVKQQQNFNSMIDFTLSGKNLLESIMSSFEQINKNTRLQYEQINHMKNDSNQLKKIAHSVIELSEQSNMLALNATIEAAKAKEHGRTFNVVASEVRDLAQKTKGSVSHIQQVVQTMFTLIEQNESTSISSVQVTDQSKKIINETEGVFKSIFASLAQHQNELSTITDKAKHVSSLTHKTTSELAILSDYLN